MADEASPLTDDERAELEALRAERAARERAELEALRAERETAARQEAAAQQSAARAQRASAEEDRRIREARERGAKLMEPDDDLRMPLGQKITLAVLALGVLIVIVMNLLVG